MLIFNDWIIKSDGDLIARQFDNLSRELIVIGDIPDGYTWEMLVQASGNLNIISLIRDQDGLSVNMTAEMLALTGTYAMQLRGTAGETVKHTNVVQVYVPESMSGDVVWPTLPSEFSQAEDRIRELNEHPPIPGDNGFWLLWNPDTKQYEESDLPLPSGGGGTKNYNLLENKPSINGVTLEGNKTTEDLNISSFPYELGETLKVSGKVLDVNTASDVNQNNTLPITAAAVYSSVGNIEILLGTI